MGEAGAYPNIARVQANWFPASSRATASGLLWLVARWGAAFSPLLFGALMRLLASPGYRHFSARLPASRRVATVPVWRMAFVYVFGSFGFSFFLSWMPRFLKSVRHIDYDKSEWMSTLPMFCAGIASLVGGWSRIDDSLSAMPAG